MSFEGVARIISACSQCHAVCFGRTARRSVLNIALFCCVFAWFAIQPASAQFTKFQNYADEQGLGNLVVDAIAQDRKGYILLGTEAGLYRYDGESIISDDVGLPSAAWIQQVVTSRNGQTWVATTDGLYVRKEASFAHVDTGRSSLHIQSPHLLAVTDGNVVLDVGGTLLRAAVSADRVGPFSPLLDPAMLKAEPEMANARFVVPDMAGGLFVGCGVAICRVADGRVTAFGKKAGLPPDAWQVALRTADGTIWARSLTQIAWRKQGVTSFTVAILPGGSGGAHTAAPGEHTSYIAKPEWLDLVDDRHGGVLTQGMGGLLDWSGPAWQLYSHHQSGLSAERIQAFTFDREGSLWVGSFGTGVYRSMGLGNWVHWTTDEGLPSNIVWSMTRLPNGQFWIATDGGTVAIDGTPAGTPAETNYVAQATQNGRLWLAPVGSQLVRRDPVAGTVERFPSLGKVVTSDIDANNRLWLGTARGLYLIADADQPASAIHPELVLAHDTTLVTTDPAGVVWMLSPDGVFRRNNTGNFDLVIAESLLESMPITLTFAPNHEVWIGTDSTGVHRFRFKGEAVEQLSSLVAPTIASNNVLFSHRDRYDLIWLGTDHGIDMFDGRLWRHFDSTDGLITNDIDQAAVYEDIDGSMWFGTSHGLSHLINPRKVPPQVLLHPLITGLSLGDRTLPLASTIRVDWSPAPLVIGFVDLDYTRSRHITFRYRLRGLDASWSTTVEHAVRYASLPAGRLDFELVAEDIARGSVSAPIGFTISIRAPWWHRWWFYVLCGLASAVVLVGAWQGRVRLLLRNQQHLENMVTARTAEIEQAKSRLHHQASVLERQAADMQRLAMSDALTSLANRRAIMNKLKQAVELAHRSLEPLAILLCDIDHFKKINDHYGHLAGDEVLIAFSGRLAAAISATEAVGRYGGEEFLFVLPGDPDTIMRRVSAIRSAMTNVPYLFGGKRRTVTFSGGLAFLRPSDTELSLLARADTALYLAKENGRNRIEHDPSDVFANSRQLEIEHVTNSEALSEHDSDPEPLSKIAAALTHAVTEIGHVAVHFSGSESDRFLQTLDLERDLRAALAYDEFTLHYQPVIDINRDMVTSCEALLRWQSPSRGSVPPGEFIPFAEEIGLMPEIGDWVLRTACREAAGWPEGLKVSVNLSAVQLRLPDLVHRIAQALTDSGLPPERLELEVTETAVINDLASAKTVLQQIRACGITIALDDFGTGYSSLSFLRILPFNRIKIDQSFIQDLGVQPQAAAIVQALVGLCASLGAAITAEGVETDRQIELLRAAGCSEVQGFRISSPRPAEAMRAWVEAYNASTRRDGITPTY